MEDAIRLATAAPATKSGREPGVLSAQPDCDPATAPAWRGRMELFYWFQDRTEIGHDELYGCLVERLGDPP